MEQGTANVVLSVLTGGLVLVTAYYAWQNKRMADEMKSTRESQVAAVDEMRRTREAETLPVLVPHVERLPVAWTVRIGVRNVGRGPALAADVTLHWGGSLHFRFRRAVIAPGEFHHTTAQRAANGGADVIYLRDPETRVLVLTGTCRDVTRQVHQVHASAAMIDQWDHNLPEALLKASNFDLAAALKEAFDERAGK